MDLKKLSLEKTKVDRDSFLRTALSPYLPSEKVEQAIYSDFLADCVDMDILMKAGNDCMRKRCMYAGGMAMGTALYGISSTLLLLPVDFAQFAYHAAKLSQELYYLYGHRDSFRGTKKEDLEVLLVMLIGADCAITLTTASCSVFTQKLYQKVCHKLSLKTLSTLPIIGSAVHGSLSAYALYSLAEEYRDKLLEMGEPHKANSPQETAKEIGTIIDVEYHEAEEKLRSFCNLEKLRDLYVYLENGYINEQEFEQLKLNL